MSNVRSYTDKDIIDRVESLSTFKGWKPGIYDIWIRSEEDQFDAFDDKAYTFEVGSDGVPKFVMVRAGTTNTGSYGLKRFKEYNDIGAAVLKSDWMIYGSHTFGNHPLRNGKPGYRQAKSWPHFRDGNRNNKAEEIGKEYSGIIGANIHRAGVNSTVIKNWSTACLVTANLNKFLSFLKYMKSKGNPALNVAILREWEAGDKLPATLSAAVPDGENPESLTEPTPAGTSDLADGSHSNSTEQSPGPSDGAGVIETPSSGMPEPAAPPKVTQQTLDVQVSEDGTTAVSASSKVGGFKWLMTAIIAIVTGQATVPEFVNNGIQSPSFWTIVLNIFANLWAFKVYIIVAILVIFIVRKLETTVLKVAAMRLNADDTKGNVVLTTPTGWLSAIRSKIGI